jgi:hypothetical protein
VTSTNDPLQPTHTVGMREAHIREEPVEWALDHVDFVLRDADAGGWLLAALVFLFVSQLEFAFIGDDVRWVLGLDEDEDAPQSAIDRVRVAESPKTALRRSRPARRRVAARRTP